MSNVRIDWQGDKMLDLAGSGLYEGIQKALEHLKAETHNDVPVDTKALRESARVDGDAENLTGRLSYNTPYAVKQHEEIGYNHPKGGKAKYLEDNFNEQQDNMLNIIAGEVDKKL